jgi:hypothetical protein
LRYRIISCYLKVKTLCERFLCGSNILFHRIPVDEIQIQNS